MAYTELVFSLLVTFVLSRTSHQNDGYNRLLSHSYGNPFAAKRHFNDYSYYFDGGYYYDDDADDTYDSNMDYYFDFDTIVETDKKALAKKEAPKASPIKIAQKLEAKPVAPKTGPKQQGATKVARLPGLQAKLAKRQRIVMAKELELEQSAEFKEELKEGGKFTAFDHREIIHGTTITMLYRATSWDEVKQIEFHKQGYPHFNKDKRSLLGPGIYLCDKDYLAYFKSMDKGIRKWIVRALVMTGKTRTWDNYHMAVGDLLWDQKLSDLKDINWPEYLGDVLKVDSVHLQATPGMYPEKNGYHPIAEQGEWLVRYQNQIYPLDAYEVTWTGRGPIKRTGKKWPPKKKD